MVGFGAQSKSPPQSTKKRLNDNLKSAVTTGETVESWYLDQGGLTIQATALEREHPTYTMTNPKNKYPKGHPSRRENERPK